MPRLDRVKMGLGDAIAALSRIAENEGGITEVRSSGVETRLVIQCPNQPPGMIRIYEKNVGLSFDTSAGKNKALGELIVDKFQETKDAAFVETKVATYRPSEADRRTIYEGLISLDRIVVSDEQFTDFSCYRFVARSGIRDERVSVTQYQTGALTLRGRAWDVWDEICSFIEDTLHLSAREVVCRFVPSNHHATVSSVITSDIELVATKSVQDRLGEAYSFLWEHDKCLLISSQCLVEAGIKLPDYLPYIAPAAKVLEGFLKKCVMGTLGFSQAEVSGYRFLGDNFTHDGDVGGLQGSGPVCHRLNVMQDTDKRERLRKGLVDVYAGIVRYRHVNLHDNPPAVVEVIDDYGTAIDRLGSIFALISNAYMLVSTNE